MRTVASSFQCSYFLVSPALREKKPCASSGKRAPSLGLFNTIFLSIQILQLLPWNPCISKKSAPGADHRSTTKNSTSTQYSPSRYG